MWQQLLGVNMDFEMVILFRCYKISFIDMKPKINVLCQNTGCDLLTVNAFVMVHVWLLLILWELQHGLKKKKKKQHISAVKTSKPLTLCSNFSFTEHKATTSQTCKI